MKILYRILLNEAKDPEGRHIAPCDGYKPEHPLVQSYSGTMLMVGKHDNTKQDELGICETLFEMFNINHPKDYRNRSMCVGDVVVIEFDTDNVVAYACDRFGFKMIEVPAGMTSLTAGRV